MTPKPIKFGRRVDPMCHAGMHLATKLKRRKDGLEQLNRFEQTHCALHHLGLLLRTLRQELVLYEENVVFRRKQSSFLSISLIIMFSHFIY